MWSDFDFNEHYDGEFNEESCLELIVSDNFLFFRR